MDTKKLILEKTLKLMIEKQNSLVSISEIKDATGIATGGIYYYFSNKEEIYDEIIERYYINYVRFDIDKLNQIKGDAKEKIHDVMVEMFKQKQSKIKIESTDEEIDLRVILQILTPNVFAYKNFIKVYNESLKELKEFLTEIIEEGQKKSQIRQDLPAVDIVESLVIMYLGIEYKWELYWVDDMVSAFEDNYDLEWEKIRFMNS